MDQFSCNTDSLTLKYRLTHACLFLSVRTKKHVFHSGLRVILLLFRQIWFCLTEIFVSMCLFRSSTTANSRQSWTIIILIKNFSSTPLDLVMVLEWNISRTSFSDLCFALFIYFSLLLYLLRVVVYRTYIRFVFSLIFAIYLYWSKTKHTENYVRRSLCVHFIVVISPHRIIFFIVNLYVRIFSIKKICFVSSKRQF